MLPRLRTTGAHTRRCTRKLSSAQLSTPLPSKTHLSRQLLHLSMPGSFHGAQIFTEQTSKTLVWGDISSNPALATMCGSVPCVGCPVSSHLVPRSRPMIHPMWQARKLRDSASGWWSWDLSLDKSDTTAQFLNDHALLKTAAFLKDKMGNEERQRFSP